MAEHTTPPVDALISAIIELTDDGHLGPMVGTNLLVQHDKSPFAMLRYLADAQEHGNADSFAWEALGKALAQLHP